MSIGVSLLNKLTADIESLKVDSEQVSSQVEKVTSLEQIKLLKSLKRSQLMALHASFVNPELNPEARRASQSFNRELRFQISQIEHLENKIQSIEKALISLTKEQSSINREAQVGLHMQRSSLIQNLDRAKSALKSMKQTIHHSIKQAKRECYWYLTIHTHVHGIAEKARAIFKLVVPASLKNMF